MTPAKKIRQMVADSEDACTVLDMSNHTAPQDNAPTTPQKVKDSMPDLDTDIIASHDFNREIGEKLTAYRENYPVPANLKGYAREKWLQENLPTGEYEKNAALRWSLVTENRGFVSLMVERRTLATGFGGAEWDDLVDSALLALFYRAWDYNPEYRFTTFATRITEKAINEAVAVNGSFEKRTTAENILEALRLEREHGDLPVAERAPFAKIKFLRNNPQMLVEWTAVAHGASNPIYLDEQFDSDDADGGLTRQVADPRPQRGFEDDDLMMRTLRSFLSEEDAHIAVVALNLDGQGEVGPGSLTQTLQAMGVDIAPMNQSVASARITEVREKLMANGDAVALMLADHV